MPPMRPDHVLCPLIASNAQDAIQILMDGMKGIPAITQSDDFIREVFLREKESSTHIGHGVAIPHARSRNVSGMVLAAGRLDQEILWDSSGKPVRIVLLMGIPPQCIEIYLGVMKAFAHGFRKQNLASRILQAPDTNAFSQILSSVLADI